MRAFLTVLLACATAAAQQPPAYEPFIEPASDEAAAHQALIRLADGLSVSLWAAEPLLANPVAFALDARGDVYVAESFRVHKGVTDIREHMDWLDDDLSCESVADRVAMYARWLGADFDSYAREHDRVRLLRDTDGDGAADEATVLADGFASHATGIGAGLLVRRPPGGAREVYYTDIPDLWRLLDADGDGVAEARESLSTGWGVRVAFMGHDMHGLRVGPDGRLYWSIGDRGFSVTTREGVRLHHPDTGAVLRCEPDGSRLEVVHLGLRNPQELAFDARGDLFTGDNNCDAGDLARLVPIVEGGDSGWRQPVQWIGDRGPWGREKLWAPRFEGQAAWIIPPIANIASGPSGLTFEPGTALPCVAGQFLLCDFTGGADSSHVWAFPIEPDGAWFRMGAVTDLVSGILNTDCDIGPDGALYVADWVEGWSGVGKGRIWRITDPGAQALAVVAETRALLGGDWAAREVGALADLLAHRDQRVRQEAQFELAARGRAGWDALRRAAFRRGGGVERLHGVRGLGQAARRDPDAFALLSGLAADEDPEVRTQLLRVLERPADGREPPTWFRGALAAGLHDASDRVAASAALAAGRLREPAAFPDLLALAPRACADPLLRHAVAVGLAGCALEGDLAAQVLNADPAARLAAVLALRRTRDRRLADFLLDRDPRVALEAARAIHDLPVPEALGDLAVFAGMGWGDRDLLPPAIEDAGLPAAREGGPEPHDDTDALVRRVLNACDRLGQPQHAELLTFFAVRDDQRTAHRRLALDMLADWPEPPLRDRVQGHVLPARARDAAPLPELARLLRQAGLPDAEDELAAGWLHVAAASGAADLAPAAAAILDDEARGLDLRVDALLALAELAPPDLPAIVDRTLSAPEARLRAEALVALEALSPELALPRALPLLDTGELAERRVAYQVLGRAAPGLADERLVEELDRLDAELVPVELRLDLALAAEARGGELATRLTARRAARIDALFRAEGSAASVATVREDDQPDTRDRGLPPVGMAVEPYLDGLFGGDRDGGRAVFERASLNCGKCHAVDEWGRQVVGPSLQGVGRRLARLQLLESVCAPNRRIAPGFGSELIFLRGGESLACRVLEEDRQAGQLKVTDAESTIRLLPLADVEFRKPSLSAMPEALAQGLSREDMRDLVEYLAGL